MTTKQIANTTHRMNSFIENTVIRVYINMHIICIYLCKEIVLILVLYPAATSEQKLNLLQKKEGIRVFLNM